MHRQNNKWQNQVRDEEMQNMNKSKASPQRFSNQNSQSHSQHSQAEFQSQSYQQSFSQQDSPCFSNGQNFQKNNSSQSFYQDSQSHSPSNQEFSQSYQSQNSDRQFIINSKNQNVQNQINLHKNNDSVQNNKNNIEKINDHNQRKTEQKIQNEKFGRIVSDPIKQQGAQQFQNNVQSNDSFSQYTEEEKDKVCDLPFKKNISNPISANAQSKNHQQVTYHSKRKSWFDKTNEQKQSLNDQNQKIQNVQTNNCLIQDTNQQLVQQDSHFVQNDQKMKQQRLIKNNDVVQDRNGRDQRQGERDRHHSNRQRDQSNLNKAKSSSRDNRVHPLQVNQSVKIENQIDQIKKMPFNKINEIKVKKNPSSQEQHETNKNEPVEEKHQINKKELQDQQDQEPIQEFESENIEQIEQYKKSENSQKFQSSIDGDALSNHQSSITSLKNEIEQDPLDRLQEIILILKGLMDQSIECQDFINAKIQKCKQYL